MKELVRPETIEKALLFAAVAGPTIGVILGTIVGAHERCAWPRIAAGALIGGLATLVCGMWYLYGTVTDALGLDSVLNLVLQLVMFALLGCALGLAMHWISVFLKKAQAGT